MKKTYQSPKTEIVRLETETPLLTNSPTLEADINDDETKPASSGLSNKKHDIWDSDNWLQ